MTLIDGHVYMLPDDTEVLAIQIEPGRFRLDDAIGQPLYIQNAGVALGVWCRVAYHAADDAYVLALCDLTNGDLWPVA